MVAEAGIHTLGGLNFEAQKIDTDTLVEEGWVGITFSQAFANAPALFTSVMTARGSDAVTSRVHYLNSSGFELAMQEQESRTGGHVTETLGWKSGCRGPGDPHPLCSGCLPARRSIRRSRNRPCHRRHFRVCG